MAKPVVETKEYNEAHQKFLIDVLLSSEEIFVRCRHILDSKYFVNKLRPAVRSILSFSEKNSVLPKIEQINAETGINFSLIEDLNIQQQDAILGDLEEFCKNRALANAVTSAVDLIEKGNYAEVEKQVREAILISLQSDIGTNYFEDPRERLMRIKNKNGQISTGWKSVDEKLYGGVNKGEITIWCGGSGAGKSLFLQNLAINFAEKGLNVVYLSLELSEDLCAMRMDSMITGIASREIFRKLDEVEIKIKNHQRKSGNIHIKQLPQGSTCNDIKAYLKNYEIKTTHRVDALIVDYLDLLFPNNKAIDPSNLFVKDKFVTEELRGIAVEKQLVLQTAAQLNRSAVQEQEHDHSHISGGISKIQTADNVISILTSMSMKERGQYQIQFLKTRSSSGVGSKVPLGFDINTLKIYSLDEDEMVLLEGTSSADVFNELRRKNATNKKVASDATGSDPVKAITDLSKLTALVRRT